MKRSKVLVFTVALVVLALSACSADGSSLDAESERLNGGFGGGVVSGGGASGSSCAVSSSSAAQSWEGPLSGYLEMVDIEKTELSRGGNRFTLDSFAIGVTEVTQELYARVMGEIAGMDRLGDRYPVFNVSWYDAVLFCNALSKMAELDTAYVYSSVSSNGALLNLSINLGAKAVRLPTENEWEVAARGGSVETYYWGKNAASKYAYYGQTKGPAEVAGYGPNAYGLYDMGGNVAEWVNDWFLAYPTKNVENYAGPNDGTYKVVRGGGWSDKVTALASGERGKKDPLYRSATVGFRVVYSGGI